MCGIFVCGTSARDDAADEGSSGISNSPMDDILDLICNRGPDAFSEVNLPPHLNWKLQFVGSVLWMQGKMPTPQPLMDKTSSVILWNGDVFDGSFVSLDGKGDTFSLLQSFTKSSTSEAAFLKSVTSIKGPYSFVYWSACSHKLWFGRDRIGRHSLLWHMKGNKFILSSVGVKDVTFMEVPTIGIFSMEFIEGSYKLVVYPWSDASQEDLLSLQTKLLIPLTISELTVLSPVLVKCPVPHEPPKEFIDFMKDSCNSSVIDSTLTKLMSHSTILTRVEQLINCLKEAVRRRSTIHPGLCHNCVKTNLKMKTENPMNCSHPKVGILFSGGLDSTIIAALAHEYIPIDEPIDLFNVAFKCQKSKGSETQKQLHEFSTPDRITGVQSCEELRILFPNRQWNFVEINISNEELQKYRRERIGDLIHPLNSVLDDSLGCALWFASRRCGLSGGDIYTSPTRVLLLGMGADEQFGGYMRHRNILRHKGWPALAAEIQLELSRISIRNLGRDDRVVSDHGCQARLPYLDEDVINYVSTLPVWARCFPTTLLPPGLGDKILLRLVAWKLGLHKVCLFPKRAFQFGSRIANSKEKATDVSSRLQF